MTGPNTSVTSCKDIPLLALPARIGFAIERGGKEEERGEEKEVRKGN